MKKLVALLLAVAMLLSFAACGKDDSVISDEQLKSIGVIDTIVKETENNENTDTNITQ